ncbi:MAG: radical SAM protein [Candidatus Sumerlaeota bacterium]|nr:radical SAM protein [Candidatus Sumerlaeota bacterium]
MARGNEEFGPARRHGARAYCSRAANLALAAVDALAPRSRLRSRPFQFHIEYNDYCNLHCIHCPRENPDIPRSTGQWTLEMLERIRPWLPSAAFVGIAGLGEPFLSKTLPEFLERIIEAGPAPSIITNGTLLTPQRAERLVGLGPMIINVSIDGATRETFEQVRRGASFDEVVGNLAALREIKERRRSPFPLVQIFWCILKENLGEEERLAELARRAGVASVWIQPAYDYGVPAGRGVGLVSNEEAEQAVARLRAAAAPKGIPIVYTPLNALPWTDNGRGRWFCPNLWKTLHFDPHGNMRVCCMGEFQLVGNVMEKPLDELWNAPAMVALRRAALRGAPPPPCRACYLLQRYTRRAAAAQIKPLWDTLRHPT